MAIITPADVKPGDDVIIIQATSPGRVPGTVTGVGPVCVVVTAEGRTYRFRRDTQNQGINRGVGGARFRTPDQDRAERRRADAANFLYEQGINLRTGSVWAGREPELADLIRAGGTAG